MMSQLSARLLAGNSSISNSRVSIASSAGYAGDVERRGDRKRASESDVRRPPPVIDFDCENHHKRRKHHKHSSIAEENYAAFTASKALAKANLSYTKIRCTKDFSGSFLPTNAKVDLSHVDLVSAKDYLLKEENTQASPFSSLVGAGAYTNTGSLTSLLTDCSKFYRSLSRAPNELRAEAPNQKREAPTLAKQNAQPSHDTDGRNCACSETGGSSRTSASDFESSTSSMTDGSDDGNSPEESVVASTVTKGEGKVCMGDALANSKLPRLIALSFSPFVVVHVNAPFTRLTKQKSIHVLGKPLHGMFLHDPVVSAALQTSCPQFTLGGLDGQVIRMSPPTPPASPPPPPSSSSSASSSSSRKSKATELPQSLCTVRVQPIGQDGQSTHITHYLIEIVQVGDKPLPALEDEIESEADQSHKSYSVGVIG